MSSASGRLSQGLPPAGRTEPHSCHYQPLRFGRGSRSFRVGEMDAAVRRERPVPRTDLPPWVPSGVPAWPPPYFGSEGGATTPGQIVDMGSLPRRYGTDVARRAQIDPIRYRQCVEDMPDGRTFQRKETRSWGCVP